MNAAKLGWFRNAVALIGAQIIYGLIWIFGRRRDLETMPWLKGPVGGDYIGERPYEECARAEGLELVRDSASGGLIPDFNKLHGGLFDCTKVDPAVRDFYENTAEFRIDVWTKTWFPTNIALWLLVTTLGRKTNQLNFPLGALDTANGMASEIWLLKRSDGSIRYTGWLRKFAGSDRVVYTGFYMSSAVPESETPCVKVIFPMPGGNATVLLRPSVDEDGSFHLSSVGRAFGDAGFYRVQSARDGGVRVWRITSLKEYFKVYTDDEKVLRCDHRIRFLGLPVLHLHYRLERERRI